MSIASTPRRNRAVLALWRAYHSHATAAKESRHVIETWEMMRANHERAIQYNDHAAVECLDILGQVGEDVSRIISLAEVEEFERRARDE